MKTIIPEIAWHNRDPVLSIDFQPITSNSKDFIRLASGGTDSHVLVWHMRHNKISSSVDLEIACDLNRHQRAVNVVRWSPDGQFLASGDDESVIFIWKRRQDDETVNILDATNEQDKETWLIHKTLRGHMEDVYDLSWSFDSLYLASGSVDNTAIIWDVTRGQSTQILRDHKGFVQGVAWDPKNKYLATLSTDRYFRVFDIHTKKVISRCNKSTLNVSESHPLHGKTVRLYHDDLLQTYFRRLAFSPDGEIIVTPSGYSESDDPAQSMNCTYIYTRYNLKKPAVVLPSPDSFTAVVKFCPIKFELRPHTEEYQPYIPLPYRMVFAVATKTDVYMYDTQQRSPIALVTNIHYTRLTDLAWSPDGRALIVSSTDGFCTLISFEENEIGDIYSDNVAMTTSGEIKAPMPSVQVHNPKIISLTPKPIAFRRKPKEASPLELNIETPTVDIPQINHSIEIAPVVVELQIPKDKIIRSDEKFETPEKKNAAPTPIAIRKTPRPLVLEEVPIKLSVSNGEKKTPPNNSPTLSKTPKVKTATPIAVRRQPRKILGGEALQSTSVNATPPNDELAMDAWPLEEVASLKITPQVIEVVPDTKDDSRTLTCREQLEETADFKLYYEDSQEECDEDVPVEIVPTPKKARRVELKTISTPKSAK